MRESKVEKLLREGVEAAGGMCEKFKSPQRAHVPDRIVTWWRTVDFVELKATGKEPNEGQLRDHDRRRALRQKVFVLDSEESVQWYLKCGRYLEWHAYHALIGSGFPSEQYVTGLKPRRR